MNLNLLPAFLKSALHSITGLQIRTIVDFEITWALVSLCELARLYVTDAQANGFLCYKCKHIFRFYYKENTDFQNRSWINRKPARNLMGSRAKT